MNDNHLRQLLHDADSVAERVTPPRGGFANRVRSARQRQIVRGRVLTTAAILLVVGGVCLLTVKRAAEIDKPAIAQLPRGGVPSQVQKVVDPTIPLKLLPSLDEQIATSEKLISRLKSTQRLNELNTRLAAIRDPIADANERGAMAILNQANALRLQSAKSPMRRELLTTVVKIYPHTISAAVARREIGSPG